MSMGILQLRLKNCIETILDLQPVVRPALRTHFADDFSVLRSYLARVESMELSEADVEKLEDMTRELLRESCFSRKASPVLAGRLQ